MIAFRISLFLEKVRSERIVTELCIEMARQGRTWVESEVAAWTESLPVLAHALEIHKTHLENHVIALEVPMPGTGARADAIIVGATKDDTPVLLVIELKRWPEAYGGYSGLVRWNRRPVPISDYHLHPCLQAEGYAKYLLAFSSALVLWGDRANAAACSFVHRMHEPHRLGEGVDALATSYNSGLIKRSPAFGLDAGAQLAAMAVVQLPKPPSADFLEQFRSQERAGGAYLQEILRRLESSEGFPWVLVAQQAEAMAKITQVLERVAQGRTSHPREVVVVIGPPGSGKTILAMQSLIQGATKHGLARCAFVTSSSHQKTSIKADFERILAKRLPHQSEVSFDPVLGAGSGALKFELEGPTARKIRSTGVAIMTPEEWKSYLDSWPERLTGAATADWADRRREAPQFDLLVCDEAQALVDPAKPRVSGSQANPWRDPWGPQAAHLILKSRITIFLMDPDQGYRQVESTRPSDIERWCSLLADSLTEGAGRLEPRVTTISLEGLQFRLAGGTALLDWMDRLLEMPGADTSFSSEEGIDYSLLKRVFQIEDDAGKMRDRLIQLEKSGQGPCRLLAGYAWEWKTKHSISEDDDPLDPTPASIVRLGQFIDSIDGMQPGLFSPNRKRIPGLCFNYPPIDMQHRFNLGGDGYHAEKLFGSGDSKPAFAGYPLTVRGRDFSHVGVIWGCDLVRRSGKWIADPELVYGSDNPSLKSAVRKEIGTRNVREPAVIGQLSESDAMAGLSLALRSAYRILLTRGMNSIHVWIEDHETREYVRGQWEQFLARQPAAVSAD